MLRCNGASATAFSSTSIPRARARPASRATPGSRSGFDAACFPSETVVCDRPARCPDRETPAAQRAAQVRSGKSVGFSARTTGTPISGARDYPEGDLTRQQIALIRENIEAVYDRITEVVDMLCQYADAGGQDWETWNTGRPTSRCWSGSSSWMTLTGGSRADAAG